MSEVHGLVPAAGSGLRFGGPQPKQLVTVAGRPLLAWALEPLLAVAASVTVAVPAEVLDRVGEVLPGEARIRWVAGGASRQASVAACLAASPARPADLVAVHDGARPALHPEDLAACLAAARGADGAVLGRPVSDTLKLVAGGLVQGTVDRSFLFRAETPQVFQRRLLESAVAAAAADGFAGTDEASLVERLPGVRLAAVAARHPNPKLTVAADLPLLEALLARR